MKLERATRIFHFGIRRPRARGKHWRLVVLLLAAGAVAMCSATDLPADGTPAGKGPRVNSFGIDGSLVLCGPGEVPGEAIEQFSKLAGGGKGRAVVVRGPEAGKEAKIAADRLLEAWDAKNLASVALIRIASAEPSAQVDAAQLVKQATAVWLAESDGAKLHALLADTPLGKACLALMQGGGVVAAAGQGAEAMSQVMMPQAKGKGAGKTSGLGGLAWLPDSIIMTRSAAEDGRGMLTGALKQNPGLVGYELTAGSVLVVTGRRITVAGPGTVTFHQAASALRGAAAEGPGKKRAADLTVMRRAAVARTDATFPPAKPGEPLVAKGSLVIVGGGNVGDDIVQKFIDLAGGKNASIVILPAAKNDPLSAKDPMIERFRKAGAKSVVSVIGRKQAEVEKPEYLDALRQATGIWFHGGRQGKINDAYEGTKVQDLMYEVLNRGGVIGGSSAGASIQTEYLVRGSPNADQNNMFEGYERGFNFLPGVAVDQHFSQRKRFGVMTNLMKTFPQFLGIGIDESTAMIVQGHVTDVMGKGKIHVYDKTKPVEKGKPDYDVIPSGGRFDLKSRKALPTPEKTEDKKLSWADTPWRDRVLDLRRQREAALQTAA